MADCEKNLGPEDLNLLRLAIRDRLDCLKEFENSLLRFHSLKDHLRTKYSIPVGGVISADDGAISRPFQPSDMIEECDDLTD